MAMTPETQKKLLDMLGNNQPESIAAPLTTFELMEMQRSRPSNDPVIRNLQRFGQTIGGLFNPQTPLDYASMVNPAAKAVTAVPAGVVKLKKIFHGSPEKNLKTLDIAKSKRSKGFMPHISGTDSPELAKAFTRGELGDKPAGKVYVSTGDFKIIDFTTDAGKKLWKSLGKTDAERAVAARKQGFDGRQISHRENWKKDYYPDVDFNKTKSAKEVQLFKDINIKPTGN